MPLSVHWGRFFALRGHAKLLRCDRGTNFVGPKTELEAAASELDEKKVETFVTECGCKWEFNPPQASHFGGVWERQIDTIRRVLDAMFTELGQSQLTHAGDSYGRSCSHCERQADSSAAVRHRMTRSLCPLRCYSL